MKYYVMTGSSKRIVTADSPRAAATMALTEWCADLRPLGELMLVSEQGFAQGNDVHPEDIVMLTTLLLDDMGVGYKWKINRGDE